MKRSVLSIENIVIKNRLMSLETIKKELKISKNTSLIRFLVDFLKKKISEINLSSDLDDLRFVYKVLNYIKPRNEEEFLIVEKELKSVLELIYNKEKIFDENNPLNEYLKTLEEYIQVFLIETKLSLSETKTKQLPALDSKKLKKLACSLLFKRYNFEYFRSLTSYYHEVYNIKIKDKNILIKIINEYLKKPDKREFYNKIISLFINSFNLNLTLEEIKEISTKIEFMINFNNLSTKELGLFKELLMFISKEKIDSNNLVDHLDKRFNICTFPVSEKIDLASKLVDMRDRLIFTIDSNGTKIFDDAFSFEEYQDGTIKLGIYLVDLSFIKPNSYYDKYAHNHFATIYLEDENIQMFPERINNFALSLGEKRAFAFSFRFTKNFEFIDCSIDKALIKVRANLNYDEVEKILEDHTNELYMPLKNLSIISDALSDSYGSIDKYHQIKKIAKQLLGERVPECFENIACGNRIVTSGMIYLNHYLAMYFYEHHLPFIYCNNDFASKSSMETLSREFRNDKEILNILKIISPLYRPSYFSSVNMGHMGLGLEAYCKATNPIRMYVSLYIQRMLDDLFINGFSKEQYLEKYQDVSNVAKEFSDLQDRNREYTLAYTRLKKRNC